ncbi:MAG: hypothetical protein SH807_07535 [Blastochloris sp.]|nr:hypothetical protein [Blastochloris sp.]
MKTETILKALQSVEAASDPTQRTLELAQLLQELFQEKGCSLIVVGGSAIELLTEGLYTSCDIDICFEGDRPPLREITGLMAQLKATGGPRSYRVGSCFVDLLGKIESCATTPFRKIGGVQIAKPEDLLAERLLMTVYPEVNLEAQACAEKLMLQALSGQLPIDWAEAERVANLPEYRIREEFLTMRERLTRTLKKNL